MSSGKTPPNGNGKSHPGNGKRPHPPEQAKPGPGASAGQAPPGASSPSGSGNQEPRGLASSGASTSPKAGRRQLKCPQCGKPASWEANPSRPFCSERCRLIDLGQWADGTYAVPAEKVEADVGSDDDENE